MPVSYIFVGKLKYIIGNQVKIVPGMPYFFLIINISIHCVACHHLFGYAFLK